jgi:RNAse (barnase) inhibitor barstar
MFVACGGGSPVDKAIADMEKAFVKYEKNKGNMTEADWDNLSKEVEEPMRILNEAAESGKLGVMQTLKITATIVKWAAVAMEAGFQELEKSTGIDRENWGEELEKAAQELTKELEKAAGEIEKEAEKVVESE